MSFDIKHTSLLDHYSGIILDAWGVFYGGHMVGALPGALDTMAALVNKGKTVVILSNASQLGHKTKESFAKAGILEGKHYHQLITSGDISKELFLKEELPFKTVQKKFFVFCGDHPKYATHSAIFEGTSFKETKDIKEADFIYVSVPHINGEDQTDREVFREHVKQLATYQLPFVCANPDTYAHEGNPPKLVVRQGSIIAICKELGAKVLEIGKPSEISFKYCLKEFENRKIPLKDIVMVGDTPETDIRGANRAGISSILLIETGMMAERVRQHTLSKAYQNLKVEDRPTFLMSKL